MWSEACKLDPVIRQTGEIEEWANFFKVIDQIDASEYSVLILFCIQQTALIEMY